MLKSKLTIRNSSLEFSNQYSLQIIFLFIFTFIKIQYYQNKEFFFAFFSSFSPSIGICLIFFREQSYFYFQSPQIQNIIHILINKIMRPVNILISSLLFCISFAANLLRSVYCPANAGIGTSFNQCQSCDEVFALDNSASPNCQPYPPTMFSFEADSHSGLNLVFPTSAQTNCGSLTTIKGWMAPADQVQVKYPGLTRPYSQIKLFVGIVTQGTWTGTEKFQISFSNQGDITSRQLNTQDIDLLGQCSADNLDKYFRVKQQLVFSTQGVELIWDILITNTQSTTTGGWAITEVLLLVKACHQKCAICTTSTTTCTSCTTSGPFESFLISSTSSCVAPTQCPASTYPDSSTHVCESCNSANCLNCSTANVCTKCSPSYYLFLGNNSCMLACPNNYYGVVTPENKCENCPNQCQVCSGASNCSKCKTSGIYQSYLNGVNCISAASCPSGTYPEPATHICTACNTSCATCSITINNCTSCISGLYYLSNLCFKICPKGYILNRTNSSCNKCFQKCPLSATICPIGSYLQETNNTCINCNTSCAACSITINNCTSCISGLYYLSNICYSNCPNGYYENTGTALCTLCDVKCTLCEISSINCSACTTNGPYQSFLKSGNICIAAALCPSGTYPEPATHICTACNTSCATCSISINNCTSCISGLYYLSNICYSNCPNGYYENTGTALCTLCDVKCTLCEISSTNCSACNTSGVNQSFLVSASYSCVPAASCPSGTYPEPATHICTACNTSCATCSITINNCTSCISGLYYLSNICYLDCPIGYYESSPLLKLCIACHPRCTSCDISQTNCFSCTTNGTNQSYLNTLNNTCGIPTSCPTSYFGNFVNHICEPCNNSCFSCFATQNNCTLCRNPLYLLSNICYTFCPPLYYGDSGLCLPCHNLCINCNGSLASECNSCKAGIFFLPTNNTCYVNCPMGYYQQFSTHLCLKCDISCSSCTNSPSPCQSCNSSYVYFNQTCLTACPPGYYGAVVTNLTYKVCKPCVQACLTCFGPTDGHCYTCNYDLMVKKSGSYCRYNCMPGWGDILGNYQYCAYCNPRCVSCYNNGNNCSSCRLSGGNQGFMIITDTLANTGDCYNPCPAGYFGNRTTHFCQNCISPCKTCQSLQLNCTSCINGTYYLNNYCYNPCPDGFFINTIYCSQCNIQCSSCFNIKNNCSLCNIAIPAFLLGTTCYRNCPVGYYQFANTTGNYTCAKCNVACQSCDGDPSPCSSCNPNFYYFQNTCNTTCYEPGYFPDNVTWQCLSCDVACVKLDLRMGFESEFEESIVVTLQFTEDLDWGTFDIENFQNFTFDNPLFTLDLFTFDYIILNSRSYQIRITPKLYIFMYNLGVRVQVMPMPEPNMNSSNWRPFHYSVFNQTRNLTWSHIKAPGVNDQQKQIVINMMNLTASIQELTNKTGFREIVQSGLFGAIFPGIQITSAIVLVNGVIPQHMYEGIRIMATFIFYQVPKWEKNAPNTRNIFSRQVGDLIEDTLVNYNYLQSSAPLKKQNQDDSSDRLLLDQSYLNMPSDWRFKRAGFTTFFALDMYMQLILIAGSWVVLIITQKCIYRKRQTHSHVRKVYLVFHKIHELSLMYVTISLVLQWLYFGQQMEENYKWISLAIGILMLFYFLAYQLYIYYDLFQYPEAHVNTRSYLIYATKYSHFLSKVRFEQYDIHEEWSPKVWFRPYNYHILSFYKKFLMIFALPIFHELPYTQSVCLIALQTLEIVRFLITWPFHSHFRNVYRLVLEVILLLIFVIVLVTQHLSLVLMQNNPLTIEQAAQWFNGLGWLGLIFVLVFNISVFVIWLIDCVNFCRKGDSLVQMDEIRKQYYWEKVKKYEDENEDINVGIVSEWVKLGNLIQSQSVHSNSKFITIKVERIRTEKTDDFFTTHITHVVDLRIKKEGFIYEQNSRRLKIRDKVRKFVEISAEENRQFYDAITRVYKRFDIDHECKKAKEEQVRSEYYLPKYKDKFELVIETFLKINLDQYPNGGRVYFYKRYISHIVSLYFNDKKVLREHVSEQMEGFPLSNKTLEEERKKPKEKYEPL